METQTEVWILEDDLLRRVAGNEVSEADRYRPVGDCADARFLVAEGIAGLPDGRLVVADPTGGGVVELSDPLADDCFTGTSGVDDGVWALDPATGELETLFVGSGLFGEIPDYNHITDYPQDLDVSGPIPTTALPIVSYSGSEGSLVRLVSNLGGGTGYHVWSVHCE